MTLHDAAMYRFGQWWTRMLRGGYGFAQSVALHGSLPERHGVVESWRAWFWGCLIPLGIAALTAAMGRRALWLLMVYPLQIARIASGGRRSVRENWWRAGALVVSKFAEVVGQLKYWADRLRGIRPRLIEYK